MRISDACTTRPTLNVLDAAVCNAQVDDDPWRPRYHFIPEPYGWMNDPNGLFYDPVFQRYHLMYQYLTPRVWGHAVRYALHRT